MRYYVHVSYACVKYFYSDLSKVIHFCVILRVALLKRSGWADISILELVCICTLRLHCSYLGGWTIDACAGHGPLFIHWPCPLSAFFLLPLLCS